jgi:flagellar secretion chaperone FliS
MSQNAHEAYLEGRILSADPLELVRMLYQGAGNAVREARRSLAEGDILGRSRAILRAYEILVELTGALDRSRAGELGERLASLYDYMQRRLIDANLQQADAPLADVLSLLATLAEAWDGARAQTAPPEASSNPWGPIPSTEPAQATHSYSV